MPQNAVPIYPSMPYLDTPEVSNPSFVFAIGQPPLYLICQLHVKSLCFF
jgi:hypothetical protein